MPEINLEQAIQNNWIKLGTFEMEAFGDRVLVVQDDFRFGTECLRCQAKDIRMITQTEQRSVVQCPDCEGKGERVKHLDWQKPETQFIVKCSTCEGHGWIICPDCNGTGAEAGLITHPQDKEERPTTGTVVSIGPDVKYFKRGESAIYPSFAGHFFKLEAEDIHGNIVEVMIGLLHENEIIARVKGHLELRRVKRSVALHTAA